MVAPQTLSQDKHFLPKVIYSDEKTTDTNPIPKGLPHHLVTT